MKLIRYLYIALISYSYSNPVPIEDEFRRAPTVNPNQSLANVQDFIHVIASFMVNLLFLSGIALLIGSLTQYIEHRKNPMNPPLSKVVTLFILGICLLGASFIPFPNAK